MTNKGMGVKNSHLGSDEWKNDKQNQHRGSHEKGEQGAAAASGHSVIDNQTGMTGEPGQSQGMDHRAARPGKSAH